MWPLLIFPVGFRTIPDPSDFLDVLFSTDAISDVESNNMAFYSNPEADKWMKAGDQEPDPKKRMEYYEKAEEVVMDDAPGRTPWWTAWKPGSISHGVKGHLNSPSLADPL